MAETLTAPYGRGYGTLYGITYGTDLRHYGNTLRHHTNQDENMILTAFHFLFVTLAVLFGAMLLVAAGMAIFSYLK